MYWATSHETIQKICTRNDNVKNLLKMIILESMDGDFSEKQQATKIQTKKNSERGWFGNNHCEG